MPHFEKSLESFVVLAEAEPQVKMGCAVVGSPTLHAGFVSGGDLLILQLQQENHHLHEQLAIEMEFNKKQQLVVEIFSV